MFTNSWGGADSAAAANMCQCVSQLALLVTGVHRVLRVESRLPPNVACLLIVKGFDRRFAVLCHTVPSMAHSMLLKATPSRELGESPA